MEKFRTCVTIETNEIWVVKQSRCLVRAWCEECRREVSLLPPSEAARLVCCELSAIYSAMARDCFHIQYFEDAKPLICLNSLCLV